MFSGSMVKLSLIEEIDNMEENKSGSHTGVSTTKGGEKAGGTRQKAWIQLTFGLN